MARKNKLITGAVGIEKAFFKKFFLDSIGLKVKVNEGCCTKRKFCDNEWLVIENFKLSRILAGNLILVKNQIIVVLESLNP